jgi:hypothetical protein
LVTELSRFGDQLPRARQRLSSGTASVLIAPSARREPTHTALARTADRELYADDDERSQRPLVSIRVEVSHPQRDAGAVDDYADAHVVDAEGESVGQTAPEREPVRMRTAIAQDGARLFAALSEPTPQSSSNAFHVYTAERGFSAYAAQRRFAPEQASSATRLLDVRA